MDELMRHEMMDDEHKQIEQDARVLSLGCGCVSLIVAVLVALLIMLLSGCRTTRTVTETVIRTDTVTVKRDSIIIHERIDTVEIALPQSSQVIEIPIEHDTVSVLTDRYYTSTAAVFGGRLRHSLMSNPGATLTGAATVHDTIKISVDSTAINNNSQHSEIKEVPVYRTHWWQRWLMWIGGIALIGGGVWTALRFMKPR
jgi:hypothetical protein